MSEIDPTLNTNGAIQLGDWLVQPALSQISRNGQAHYLEPKLMAVLMRLVEHADEIVSNDTLIHEVWNDRPMGDNPVYRCIAELRKIFGDSRQDPQYIATVPKRGYRLIAPVTSAGPEEEAISAQELPDPDQPTRWSPPQVLIAGGFAAIVVLAALAWYFMDFSATSVPTNIAATACAGTASIEACQQYKLANEQLRTRGEGFKTQALGMFESAILIDPGFAAAYAGTARAYLLPGNEIPWPEAVDRARLAVERALELDDKLPEAHLASAMVLVTDPHGPCPPVCRYLFGYADAEQAARSAMALGSESADAHNILALTLYAQGRLSEAEQHYQIALRHDPLNPAVNYNLAFFKAYQGQHEHALRSTQEFIDSHPNPPVYMYTALALIENFFGRFDNSLEILGPLANTPIGPTFDWLLTENYLQLGLFDQVDRVLAERSNAPYFEILSATTLQRILVLQGRIDELDEFSKTLIDRANDEYGTVDQWPRWLQRVVGKNQFWQGNFEEAAIYLTRVHGVDGTGLDHQFITAELDSLHALGHSLKMLGEPHGDTIIEHTVALLNDRKAQGFDGLPDLTAARARAYAIQGKRALAIATLYKAADQGWRGYRAITDGDPRWQSVLREPDLESLLVRVQGEVEQMRDRAEIRLADLPSDLKHMHAQN